MNASIHRNRTRMAQWGKTIVLPVLLVWSGMALSAPMTFNTALPVAEGEFARLLDDPFEGIEVVDGLIHLPDGPGAGVVPVATAARAAG